MIVKLLGLPKISTNEIYAGVHWRTRKKHKDLFHIIVKNQFKHVFTKNKTYSVHYTFFFKNNPLDATNCSYMIKLIEDVIFESDTYKIIEEISIKSRISENKTDYVEIEVLEN